MEMVHVLWDEVRQVGVLGVIPDHLHWVELRCISRQPNHLEPIRMCRLEQSHGFAMRAEAVQDDDELASQTAMDGYESRGQTVAAQETP